MDVYVFPMHNAFDNKEFTYRARKNKIAYFDDICNMGIVVINTRFYAYVLWFAFYVHQLLSV